MIKPPPGSPISDREERQIQQLVNDSLLSVGKLAQNSGLADLYLFMVFRHLSGCDTERADAIYFALDAHAAKANIVLRLARLRGSKQITDAVQTLVGAVKSAHKPRNGLAHSVLGFDGDGRPILRNPKLGKPSPLNSSSLKDSMRQSGEAVVAVKAAFAALIPIIGLPPGLML